MENKEEQIINILRKEDIINLHTLSEEEFNKAIKEIDNFKVLISPFSESCVVSASYDVRIGEKCTNLKTQRKFTADEISENGIQINPNDTVLIRALEKIGIPYNCTALVTTKISLAKQGILQITSRVDPGYVGPLDIVLFNAGGKQMVLRPKDGFANLVFFKIGTPVSRGYDKDGSAGVKGSSPYTPVSIEEVMGDAGRRNAIETMLKYGPPYDYAVRLIQRIEEDFNRKIEKQTNDFGFSVRSWKTATVILAAILGLIVGAKVEFIRNIILSIV